jgi:hypothetical protein
MRVFPTTSQFHFVSVHLSSSPYILPLEKRRSDLQGQLESGGVRPAAHVDTPRVARSGMIAV